MNTQAAATTRSGSDYTLARDKVQTPASQNKSSSIGQQKAVSNNYALPKIDTVNFHGANQSGKKAGKGGNDRSRQPPALRQIGDESNNV